MKQSHFFQAWPLRLSAMLTALWLASPALAQQVQTLSLDDVPPDMVEINADSSAPGFSPIDLGEDLDGASTAHIHSPGAVPASRASGVATRAAQQARSGKKITRRPDSSARQGAERAVFDRHPVRVPLPVDVERLVTLPAPAALHVPSDMARVARLEVIDKTIYATALVPFTPIRIVAELIDSGQQIPLDLVAGDETAGATAELEVFVVEPEHLAAARGEVLESDNESSGNSAPETAGVDMVELTRHAARQLYAPRRLAWTTPGVQQVEIGTTPVEGLIRGVDVQTTPLGQWRGGRLYVTAVRVTNQSRYPVEIPLEDIRGQWLAATAQHGRIGPAGSETDTTAVYLVCDRAFEACR